MKMLPSCWGRRAPRQSDIVLKTFLFINTSKRVKASADQMKAAFKETYLNARIDPLQRKRDEQASTAERKYKLVAKRP